MKNDQSSLTSLISTFSRAYHHKEDSPLIFNDPFAKRFLSDEQYAEIGHHMTQGISFFNPEMAATNPQPNAILKWVHHIQLAPTPLARAAFAERIVLNEFDLGATQYVILGAGLDSFAWRYPDVDASIFEVDHPATQQLKKQKVQEADLVLPTNVTLIPINFMNGFSIEDLRLKGFDPNQKTVITLLGVSYYLTEEVFQNVLHELFEQLPIGSSIIFDFADERLFTERGLFNRVQHMVQMAAASGEPMTFYSSLQNIEKIMNREQLLIYEHVSPEDIQTQFFSNRDDELQAFETIHYVHAVKRP
ncbi:class I SAM-dependent methyltransferase [Kurthia senegalensis]|uniref:class I SAM-dependent methyltransferase n=1 Tax=Kurthia senegalensis TaxID=1033740 RepID=UPI0002885CBC|nr:class I SAM-dependent methyltransferase [Kurthia senegalensis]